MKHSTNANPAPTSLAELQDGVAALIETFGRRRTLLAVFKAYFSGKAHPPDVSQLNERLQRDIGLPPQQTGQLKRHIDPRF